MFKKKCHSYNEDGVWLSLMIFIIVNLRMMWKMMPIIIHKSCVSPYWLWWNKQRPLPAPDDPILLILSLSSHVQILCNRKAECLTFLDPSFLDWDTYMPFVMERNGILTSENNWIRNEWISDTTLKGRGGVLYACCFTWSSHSWMIKNWSSRWSQAHSCHSQLRQAP